MTESLGPGPATAELMVPAALLHYLAE